MLKKKKLPFLHILELRYQSFKKINVMDYYDIWKNKSFHK